MKPFESYIGIEIQSLAELIPGGKLLRSENILSKLGLYTVVKHEYVHERTGKTIFVLERRLWVTPRKNDRAVWIFTEDFEEASVKPFLMCHDCDAGIRF